MIDTVTRNASLQDLAAMLKDQHARKVDMVAPASTIRLDEGLLKVKGMEPLLTDDGVTLADGTYTPTAVFDEGLADKLGIGLAYVRKLREQRPDLLDANVNGWLHGRKEKRIFQSDVPEGRVVREAIPGDDRSFLLRCFKPDDGEGMGIARAFLSDRFQVVDHLDALTAALDGVKDAGVDVVVENCDLTERRMTVKVVAPEVQVLAERLLKGYRNPFGADFDRWRRVADREGLGYGGEEPIVFAGFRLSNSETGGGAFTIVPEMRIKVCANGLVISKDAIRQVHLGGRLEEGLIRWSEETQRQAIGLVRAKTRDAVATFLDVDYMEKAIASITDKAERPVDNVDEVKQIGKKLAFTQEHIDGVLEFFVRGGQMTRGGVMNAVTAYSQTVEDPDTAYDLEAQALRVLEVTA